MAETEKSVQITHDKQESTTTSTAPTADQQPAAEQLASPTEEVTAATDKQVIDSPAGPATAAEPDTPEPEESASFFTPDSAQPAPVEASGEPIIWTASEFVAHQKSLGWYALLGLGTVVIAGVIFLLTKDTISTSVIIIAGIVLGVYGARQPRQIEYQVDARGVRVDQKYYEYDTFRSFSIVPEGAFSSIIFTPLKRFASFKTIYYAPEDEAKIVALLDSRLPLQEYSHDIVDQLMRHIRF